MQFERQFSIKNLMHTLAGFKIRCMMFSFYPPKNSFLVIKINQCFLNIINYILPLLIINTFIAHNCTTFDVMLFHHLNI